MYLAEQNATLSLFIFAGLTVPDLGVLSVRPPPSCKICQLNSFAGEQRVQMCLLSQ